MDFRVGIACLSLHDSLRCTDVLHSGKSKLIKDSRAIISSNDRGSFAFGMVVVLSFLPLG